MAAGPPAGPGLGAARAPSAAGVDPSADPMNDTPPPPPRGAAGRAGRAARALIVAGAALVALAAGARVLSVTGSEAGLERFRQARAGVGDAGAAAARWEGGDPDRSLWAQGRIAAWETSRAHELGLPLGVLRIPRLGLEVPVWHGVDEPTLNRGLGRIPGTAPLEGPGNVALAGHRDGFFRVLEHIAAGDRVELETLGGVRGFAVTDTWIVDPQSVWVLDPTPEPSLTLVTCYPFYFVGKAPQRFVVRASAIDGDRAGEDPLESGGEGTAAADPADNPPRGVREP